MGIVLPDASAMPNDLRRSEWKWKFTPPRMHFGVRSFVRCLLAHSHMNDRRFGMEWMPSAVPPSLPPAFPTNATVVCGASEMIQEEPSFLPSSRALHCGRRPSFACVGQQAEPEFKWLMGVVSKGECATAAMVPSILEAMFSFCRSSVERRSRGCFDRVGGLIARGGGGGWCGLRPGQLVSRQTANKWTKIVKCASASSVLLTDRPMHCQDQRSPCRPSVSSRFPHEGNLKF